MWRELALGLTRPLPVTSHAPGLTRGAESSLLARDSSLVGVGGYPWMLEGLRGAGSLGRVEPQQRTDKRGEEVIIRVQPVAQRGHLGRSKENGRVSTYISISSLSLSISIDLSLPIYLYKPVAQRGHLMGAGRVG